MKPSCASRFVPSCARCNWTLENVLPMVARLSDVNARKLSSATSKEPARGGTKFSEVSVGAMIEVPFGSFMADKIARIVDFFELGHQ